MRPRVITSGAALAAAMLLAGPGAGVGGALEDDGAIGAGSASASSAFVTYFDEGTFFEGATLGTADFHLGYATGEIDRSGSSGALAGVAYSPYVDLPPAVNALAGTNIDFDPILSRARASVTGQPPKDAVASLSTPTDQAEAGTMEAHLAAGPVVDAFTTLARIEPAPATHIKSAITRIRVAKVSGKAITEASTILRSVSIAGLITFDSITLKAVSVADGAAGESSGSIIVEGGSIAGTPIAIDEGGIHIADQIAPFDLAQLESALAQAGIELIGPSTVKQEPGGEFSITSVRGPQITYTSSQGNNIRIVLGRAEAASTLLPGFSLPTLPEVPPVVSGPVPQIPIDTGAPGFVPPAAVTPQAPAVPGQAVVDLSRLILSDAKSVDGFAALYSALAVGGMLILAGLVAPRRRSLLEERFR
ncbi:MAG: hypothetical protein ACRDJ1_09325 [Actinomycetota bacterium]